MKPRYRRGIAATAAALAIVLTAGCGDDDETASPASTGAADEAVAEPTEGESEAVEEEPDGETAPEVSDEGHVGGGPDPGTEEAEQAEESAGGTPAGDDESPETGDDSGGGADGSRGGTGAPTGPEAFEQFCEQNPEACE